MPARCGAPVDVRTRRCFARAPSMERYLIAVVVMATLQIAVPFSALLLGVCAVLASGARPDNSLEAYFDIHDPAYADYQRTTNRLMPWFPS